MEQCVIRLHGQPLLFKEFISFLGVFEVTCSKLNLDSESISVSLWIWYPYSQAWIKAFYEVTGGNGGSIEDRDLPLLEATDM